MTNAGLHCPWREVGSEFGEYHHGIVRRHKFRDDFADVSDYSFNSLLLTIWQSTYASESS